MPIDPTIDIVNAPPGMIPIVRGGLGNQMFVVAAAYVASRVKDCPLYMLSPHPLPNKHNKLGHDYNETIFRDFGVQVPSIFVMERYDNHNNGNDGFAPWNPETLRAGTCLDSYYQYYPPLKPFEAEIRERFRNGLRFPGLEDAGLTTAFLHIRRGDYLALPNFHYLQPISYYMAAVECLKAKLKEQGKELKRIVVHSDDIAWAKEQEFFRETKNAAEEPLFEFFESDDELEALAHMASCRAGAICANSTFSWWGAFLGAYGEGAPVIVPPEERWINQKVFGLFPPSWIKL